jgi:hypothetical protein
VGGRGVCCEPWMAVLSGQLCLTPVLADCVATSLGLKRDTAVGGTSGAQPVRQEPWAPDAVTFMNASTAIAIGAISVILRTSTRGE